AAAQPAAAGPAAQSAATRAAAQPAATGSAAQSAAGPAAPSLRLERISAGPPPATVAAVSPELRFASLPGEPECRTPVSLAGLCAAPGLALPALELWPG